MDLREQYIKEKGYSYLNNNVLTDYALWLENKLADFSYTNKMEINNFIDSIENEIFNRIRNSKSDAEARRLLKEHQVLQLLSSRC